MNISIFNKPYTVRRFGEQKIIKGYATCEHEDITVHIHVHPGSDQVKANPQGITRAKRLEGHGSVELFTANEQTNRQGDLLNYNGEWYECVSCVFWDHTLLKHYNYQFALVPRAAKTTHSVGLPVSDGSNECDEFPWYIGNGGSCGACK